MHQQLAKHNPAHRAAFVEIVTNSGRARQASQKSSPWQLGKLLLPRSERTPWSWAWSAQVPSSGSKTSPKHLPRPQKRLCRGHSPLHTGNECTLSPHWRLDHRSRTPPKATPQTPTSHTRHPAPIDAQPLSDELRGPPLFLRKGFFCFFKLKADPGILKHVNRTLRSSLLNT